MVEHATAASIDLFAFLAVLTGLCSTGRLRRVAWQVKSGDRNQWFDHEKFADGLRALRH